MRKLIEKIFLILTCGVIFAASYSESFSNEIMHAQNQPISELF